ncbi:MAG: ArnT family glycosyltransferase [Gemmatimonadaceae bacterium]
MLNSRAERWYSVIGTRKKDAICVLVLCVLTLLTWIPRARGPIDLRWDAGVYYVLGTSLAEGKGYRLLNEPGEIQAIQYPPLLPAIVALHQKALGTSDPIVVGRWLRFTWIFLTLLYVPLTFLLARRFFARRYAFVVALLCLLSASMFFFATLLFAELPFAVATTLFAALYYKSDRGRLASAGVGASAIASYLLRTIGIAALAAWVLDALFRKRFRTALVRAAVALVPVLLWQAYIHNVQSGYRYTHPFYPYQRDASLFYNVSYGTNVALKSPFTPELGNASTKDLVVRFVGNAVAAPNYLGQSVAGDLGQWEPYVWSHHAETPVRLLTWRAIRLTFYLIGVLILGGIALQLWRRQWLIGLYFLLTLGALGTSPWPAQTLRYLTPLLPFSLVAMMGAILVCIRGARGFLGRRGAVGGLGSGWRRATFPSESVTIGVQALAVYVFLFAFAGVAVESGRGYHKLLDDATYRSRDGVNHPYKLVHFWQGFSSFYAALKWLGVRAEPGAIVAVSMPQWTYLESGLKSVMTPFQEDPGTAQQLLDDVPASYVILEQTGSYNRHLPAQIRRSGDKWLLVYSSVPAGVEIYRRVGRGAPPAMAATPRSAQMVPSPSGQP